MTWKTTGWILSAIGSLSFVVTTPVWGAEETVPETIAAAQLLLGNETAIATGTETELKGDDRPNWIAQTHHHHPSPPQPPPPSSPDDLPIPDRDLYPSEHWPHPPHGNQTFWKLLFDQLEYRDNEGDSALNWDAQGWVGGDYQRLWLKTKGEVSLTEQGAGDAEVQVLYSRLIDPFWEFQAGLRYDHLYGGEDNRGRAFAVVGLQGTTPYLFEVDTALFVSQEGDVSARFTVEKEILLSQRLILQPELEVNVAAQTVEAFGIGSGLNDLELGLRLRYEFDRHFAPYVGLSWTRKFGETASLAREEGEDVDTLTVVGGMRLLF